MAQLKTKAQPFFDTDIDGTEIHLTLYQADGSQQKWKKSFRRQIGEFVR